jgi:hypothetical protein
LFEGVFSDRLKYATIVPVYKKGDKNMVANYRPIFILTSINKIFEKVMYSRLLKHLKDSRIISLLAHHTAIEELLDAIFSTVCAVIK